jgi:hypothetical protein
VERYGLFAGGRGAVKAAHARPVLVDADAKSRPLESLTLGGKVFGEGWLQGLIHKHPDCLPVAEIEPGFGELVSVGMEVPTKHGPIDNLLMTPDGDIVQIEAKLWHNPQARREVVAQALDYASCLFEWDYEDLERAVLKAGFGELPKPDRLYDLFADGNGRSESAFVDAVNANLRKGRVLILVVGDGIRTEARRLASVLESHAGAHFTFALVELNVFRLDEHGGLIVCPRILAQTEMISRGVVEILDHRTIVSPPKIIVAAAVSKDSASRPQPESITAEQFYEAMAAVRPDLPDRLRAFVGSLASLGVEADFQRALNLKWEPPVGKPINLGTIQRNGQVWTDAVNAHAPHNISHRYVEELASAFGMEIEKEAFKGAWHVRTQNHAPRIQDIADKLDLWVAAIERFVIAMKEHLADQGA